MLREQYSRSRSTACTPVRSHPRRHQRIARSHRFPVVATSEFWWEDEQEFDALTEVLQPKQVCIATPATAAKHLQQLKASTKFVAAFTAPGLKAEAEQIWEQLGRAGPPLFLKVRVRDSLQECQQTSDSSSAAAEQFWQEMTGQTWRTELDHGLAGAKDATAAAAVEQILVILGSEGSIQELVKGAVGKSSLPDGADISVVEFDGWNQGATQQQLTSWRDQLKPRIRIIV